LEKIIEVPVGTQGGVVVKKYKGYQLLFKDYKTLGITDKTTALAKIRELGTSGKPYSDPVMWTAIGQLAILKMQIQPYLSNATLNRRGFYFQAWGEYEGGPAYGWITKVKFNTAVEFYTKNNPGKTKEDLQKACKEIPKNMIIPAGKAVFAQWLEGQVFGA
jgi:hypothetical protein